MPRKSALFAVSCLMMCSATVFEPDASRASEGEAVLGLAGRWAGEATLVPASGQRETFKCIITYFPSDDGSRVRQNLRCKNANYRFDAATHLQISGRQVTGRWEDNVNSLNGTVLGTMTHDGFDILLSGKFFDAKMTVVSTACEQSVTIIPDKAHLMRELAAVLRKC